jgi:hypothetical protein
VVTTLVVSACTRLNPRTCIALSTADSLQLPCAQHSLGAAWSEGYDARCFSMPSPQSITCIALSTGGRLLAACQLQQPGAWWLRRSLFQHASVSIHKTSHCQSTVLLQRSAASLGAAWSIAVADARCFSMHPPQSTPRIVSKCPPQIHSSSAAPVLVQPGA